MKTITHTLTPYCAFENHDGTWFIANTDDPADEDRTVIATCPTEANAAFIVRACNNTHEELVEALDQAARWIENVYDTDDKNGHGKYLRRKLVKAKRGAS